MILGYLLTGLTAQCKNQRYGTAQDLLCWRLFSLPAATHSETQGSNYAILGLEMGPVA